jgi:TonB-dependent receptor
MQSFSLRAAMLSGIAAVAAVAPAPAAAQSMSFNIPAQDLAGALQQFALRANKELLFSPDLVAHMHSPPLVGSFTPDEALRRLLNGTSVTFREVSANVFVLERGTLPTTPARLTTTSLAQTAPPETSPTVQPGVRAGSISGRFFDQATDTPVTGAFVRIEGTRLDTTTDEFGSFRFPTVPAGNYTVVLEYLGDTPKSQPVTVVANTTAQLIFTRGGSPNDIVVYGTRSATQRALNEQRTNLNNSTVVSADFLGGFPAETVSEALRRVPGVAFGRDEATGEGSRITIRGFSSEAINVQVNGVDLQGTNFTRTVDLSGFLADNLSKVTIQTSLLPSQEATGSGGLVEIETKSGLDYGNFQISGGIEREMTPASGFGHEWEANGTIAGKITDAFGLAATIDYRKTDRTNYDVFNNSFPPTVFPAGFSNVFLIPSDMQFPFDPEFNERLDTSVTYIRRDRDEKNLAASLNAAWNIADHTHLRFDLQHNERDAFNFFSRSAIQFLTAFPNPEMPISELGGEVRRRVALSGLRPGLSMAASDLSLKTDTLSLRGDTHFDRWSFHYKVGYSAAREKSRNNNITMLAASRSDLANLIDSSTIETAPDAAGNQRVIGGAFVPGPNGVPVPSLTQAGFDLLLDPSTYRIVSAGRSITDSPTHAWIGELKGRYSFGSWLDYIELGGKYDRSDRSALDDAFAADPASLRSIGTFSSIFGRDTFISDIDPNLLITNSLGNIGLGGFTVPSISAAGNEAIFEAMEGLIADDPSTPENEARFIFRDLSDLDPIHDVGGQLPAKSLEEKLAGYLEAHVEFGKFDVVGGARVERTHRTGTTLSIPSVILNAPGFQTEPRETFVTAGLVDFSNLDETDRTITPSFLVNYRPNRDIVARLGYFRSTVNPSILLLRRERQVSIDLRPFRNQVTLREGNPDLKPSTTDNWDLDVAYYFRDSPGLVRAGAFYKTIDNNFTNVFVRDVPSDEVRQQVLDFFGPLAQQRPDLVAFNDETKFLFSRPVNGEGGTIWGLEAELIRQLNFLPGWLSGLGVLGNVTYTNGDFPTLVSGVDENGNDINISLDRPLADEAKWVYNAGLTYTRGGFDGRLIYTHQDPTAVAYDVHDLNTIVPAFSTLDLRMSYHFDGPGGALYTLYLEGDDLLHGPHDPDIRSAISNTFGRSDAQFFFPKTYQFSGGRTITVGAKVRF